MKTHMINQHTAQHHFLILALMMSALLACSIGVQAQSPPTTYSTQSDGAGPYPATVASGSNGGWSFTATLPGTFGFWSYWDYADNGGVTEYYGYDYNQDPLSMFTLTDGTDTFTGYFTGGTGSGYSVDYGPPFESLTLDMQFTGQWNTGAQQAGNLLINDTFMEGVPESGYGTLDLGPAPEPGSLLLFGSGIVGLAGILRRRLMG